MRIAIMQSSDTVELGGGGGLQLRDEVGRPLLNLAPGGAVRVVPADGGVALQMADLRVGPAQSVEVLPADSEAGLVRVQGRDYRGRVVVDPDGARLRVVNRLDVESYLAGVVNAEMGRRAPEDEEALRAQAIVSRTFALRAMSRNGARPYDLVATVADQAYGGVGAELDQGWQAVQATRGMLLTYQGQPIEAFFHSTCGGRTAAGDEVYANGGLPYLQSVSDAAPDGSSYCAISPRYRWEEHWTAAALTAVLRSTLPPLGIAPARVTGLRDVAVTEHTASGRVARIAIQLEGVTVPVSGPAVRQVLRPSSGELLRSAAFRLLVERSGGRLAGVTAQGQGAGHGVGLCQWGAVGRARAGQTAAQILSTYFPGTVLERRW